MGRKLKAGVISCGGIAAQKHLPAIAKINEVEVTAFCDIIPDQPPLTKKCSNVIIWKSAR